MCDLLGCAAQSSHHSRLAHDFRRMCLVLCLLLLPFCMIAFFPFIVICYVMYMHACVHVCMHMETRGLSLSPLHLVIQSPIGPGAH